MSDYYFSTPVNNRRALCISPLTNEELGGGKIGGNSLGYYLYERDEGDDSVIVLAKIASPDAAVQLQRALQQLSATPL
jgi:hypothetical protein